MKGGKKYDYNSQGFPSGQSSCLRRIAVPLANTIKSINEVKITNERENNLIYFQDVVKGEEHFELPPAVHVMKPVEFKPFESTEIHLFVRNPPKKGFLRSLFSGGKKEDDKKADDKKIEEVTIATGQSSVSPDAVIETRQRSDSEIAREFQRRINAGEDL